MIAKPSTAQRCLRLLLLGVVWLGATVNPASASSITYTNSSAGIGTAFTVDWGGPDLTPVGSPLTQGPVTVSGAADFGIFSGATYNADFLPTDWVLSLYDLGTFTPLPGLFRIDFAAPVNSAGAQVQALSFGPFSGTISAFDVSNALLGVFSVNGANGGNGDGSAVFAGIVSDSMNISRLEFAGFGDGAAIGELRAGSVPSTAPVPEPSTFVMLMGGGALLAARRRRRQSAMNATPSS
jgi:hypothetical protein